MQQQNKKSKFKKWLYRLLFAVLILLMLLQLHHYDTAIDALAKLNVEQNHTIDSMQKELHNIDLHNHIVEHQLDEIKLKINGSEVPSTHNEIPHTDLHKDSKVHTISLFSPASVISTTTVTVLTLVRGIASLIPVFN